MKTRTAKTAMVGAFVAALAVALVAYSAMASPTYAQTQTSSSTSTPQTPTYASNWMSNRGSRLAPPGNGAPFQWSGSLPPGPARRGGFGLQQSQVNLTVGQTITVTSSQGMYREVGSPSSNGTASGSVTFTVTGKLAQGYTLSLSSGTLTVAGTTYTISSGSAQMNRGATAITGQGATNPTGQFIVRAAAHGTFAGSSGSVYLDFTNGTTEYLVILNGSVQ